MLVRCPLFVRFRFQIQTPQRGGNLSDTSEPEGVDAFSSFTKEQLGQILEVAKAIEEMGGNTKLISLCGMVGGNALDKIRLAQKSGVVTTFESFDDAANKQIRHYTVSSTKLSAAKSALEADPGTTKEDDTMAVGAEKCKGPVTLLYTMRGLSPDNSLMEKEPLVEALVGKRDYMGWKRAEARQRANVLISNNVANGKVTKTATGQLKISTEGRKYLEDKLAEYPELAISEATGDDKGSGSGGGGDDLDDLAKQAGELVKSEEIPALIIFNPDAISALTEKLNISKEKSERVWRRAEELKLIEIADDEDGDTLLWLPEEDDEGTAPEINVPEHVKNDPGVIKVDGATYPAGAESKKPTTSKGITYTNSTLGVDVSFKKDVDFLTYDREFTVGAPGSVDGDVMKLRFVDGVPAIVLDEMEVAYNDDGLALKTVSE